MYVLTKTDDKKYLLKKTILHSISELAGVLNHK